MGQHEYYNASYYPALSVNCTLFEKKVQYGDRRFNGGFQITTLTLTMSSIPLVPVWIES